MMNTAKNLSSFLFMPVFLAASYSCCLSQDCDSGTFTDPRDSNVYEWVRIGGQIWMAENLRFKPDSGSWCWDNQEDNCETKGRFYNWETAMQVSPPGWHLPTDEEWKKLEITLGLTAEQASQDGFRVDRDSLLAGKIKLLEAWPNEYEGRPIDITNKSGFSAISTGFYANDEFTHAGYASWWTSNDDDSFAWIRHIGFHNNTISRVLNRKEFAFSIRCIRDETSNEDSETK